MDDHLTDELISIDPNPLMVTIDFNDLLTRYEEDQAIDLVRRVREALR